MEVAQNLVFEASGPSLVRTGKVKTTTVALKTLFVIITVFIHAINIALTVTLKEANLGHLDGHGVDLAIVNLSRRVSSARPPTDIQVGGARLSSEVAAPHQVFRC